MKEIRVKLVEELESEINDLTNIDLGSKEYAEAIKGIAELHKLVIEEDKLTLENKVQEDKDKLEHLKHIHEVRKFEEELDEKDRKCSDERKDKIIGYVLTASGIVLPLIFYGTWMHKGFKFEETGTITSSTFKGLIRFFKPTK